MSGGSSRKFVVVRRGDALAAWREGFWGIRLERERCSGWLRWVSVVGGSVALGILAGVWLAGEARAEVVPPRGAKDPRVRTVLYDPEEVVRLQGYVGYQIHLQFAPGESFVNLASGDTAGIDVGSEGSHLLLKPKQASVATNLTILTTQRVYTIAYSATRGTPDPVRDEVVWSLRFRYPEIEAAEAAAAAKPLAAKPINTRYRFCGAPSVRPAQVWDDGEHTHLAFRDQTEIPAVYVEEADGGESVVNFHVDASGLVVHRVAKKLVLRRGALRACVENRGWSAPEASASGEREEGNQGKKKRTREGPGKEPRS